MANSPSSTLLVVDDDPHIREALQRSLSREPYRVLSASSAEEALALLDKEEVDVVLSDEHMPGGMGGVDFFVVMRKTHPEIIRMMLTGHIKYEVAFRAMNEGRVFQFISKPYDSQELAIAIRYAMQHKRTEDLLRESEERFRRLAEATFEGIVISEEGRILDANPNFTKMFGYELSEIIGTHGEDIVAPESRAAVMEKIASGYETYEGIGLRKDGSTFHFEANAKAITYKKRMARVVAVRDITERKRDEQELILAKERAESATRVKDQFISLVSHNLKSPLASMMALIQSICMDGEPVNSKCRTCFDSLMQNAERSIAMVEELLNYSRLQGGIIKTNPKFFDGRAVASLVAMSLEPLAAEKGVEIINDVPPNTRLYADPHLFVEVIQNLVSNAIKFCRKGDAITIFAPPGMGPSIAVKDTGVGISEDILPNLFRNDVLTTTIGGAGEKGTGLGLPMSYDIMKIHGGNITVESKRGEGSVFYANLPYVKPVALALKSEGSARSIIEDCLQRMDVEARIFTDVETAMSAIRKDRPHVVIAGHAYGVDGLSLLERLKKDDDTKTIPMLIITADEHEETRKQAADLGADDFMVTPFTSGDLTQRLRRHIS
jgi:PAS domain S-box-containing protein